MTEINVTSPSAVRQINQVNGVHLEKQIVDAMLTKVEEHRFANQTAPQSTNIRRFA
jgi:hypothetical protein